MNLILALLILTAIIYAFRKLGVPIWLTVIVAGAFILLPK